MTSPQLFNLVRAPWWVSACMKGGTNFSAQTQAFRWGAGNLGFTDWLVEPGSQQQLNSIWVGVGKCIAGKKIWSVSAAFSGGESLSWGSKQWQQLDYRQHSPLKPVLLIQPTTAQRLLPTALVSSFGCRRLASAKKGEFSGAFKMSQAIPNSSLLNH